MADSETFTEAPIYILWDDKQNKRKQFYLVAMKVKQLRLGPHPNENMKSLR